MKYYRNLKLFSLRIGENSCYQSLVDGKLAKTWNWKIPWLWVNGINKMKPISRLHLSPIDISLYVCKYSNSGMQIIFSPKHFEYKVLTLHDLTANE